MRLEYITFLQHGSGELICFYIRDGAVFVRSYQKDSCGARQRLAEGAKEILSVCEFSKAPHVLYISSDNELCFLKFEGFKRHPKIKRLSGSIDPEIPKKYCAIPCSSGISIIYTLPLPGGNFEAMLDNMDGSGSETMFKLNPIGKSLFHQFKIIGNIIIIFYKNADNSIVYRELIPRPYKITGEQELIKEASGITEISFLVHNGGIHMLYVQKSRYVYKVCRRYKNGDDISPAETLWEGRGCEKPLVFADGDTVYFSWIFNNSLIFTQLTEGGSCAPLRKFKTAPPKGVLLAELNFQVPGSRFLSSCIYSDSASADIYLHDRLCSNLLASSANSKPNSPDYKTCANYKEETEMLKNKIDMLDNENMEKTTQLLQLSNMLTDKNNEILQLNSRFRKRNIDLENELNKLRLELNRLKKENYQLNNIIEDLLNKESV